jgi:hypothetical protein
VALLDGAKGAGTAELAVTAALAVPDAVGAGSALGADFFAPWVGDGCVAPGGAVAGDTGPAEVWLLGAGASTLCSVVGAGGGADAGTVGGRLASRGATPVLTGGSSV